MATGWQQIGGNWYLFSKHGSMATGWQQIGGNWYHLNSNGAMSTGWQQIGGTWYYFNGSGAMATKKWIEGTFYVDDSGAMLVSTTRTIDGWNYTFDGNGRWITVNNGGYSCPAWAPIKGNASSKIYHRPGNQSYNITKPEACFSTGTQAEAAGYHAAKR